MFSTLTRHARSALAFSLIIALPLSAAQAADIRLAHALSPDKAEQLGKLVERFNESSKVGKVALVSYEERAQADLVLPREEDEAAIVSSRRFKPLWEMMREAQVPLNTFSQFPRMVMPMAVDDKGRLQALPIAMSTPVVFVNRPALQQVGIDADNLPNSWLDWQNELAKLANNRYLCPFTTTRPVKVFVENTGAWNAQATTVGAGKTETLAANGLMHVKHLAMMITWYKANYLKLFGHADEAEEQFVSGNCVIMIASSASYPELQRKTKFQVGVAPLPYHEGAYGAPQNTVADGASLWVSPGRSKDAYRTAARFVSYFLTPESQITWQVGAGYLPLNTSGVFAATESSLLRDELAAQRVAVKQLTNKPVTPASAPSPYMRRASVQRLLQEELEAAWSGTKTAKQALDSAVLRARGL